MPIFIHVKLFAMRPGILFLLFLAWACTGQKEAEQAYKSELKELIPLKGHDPYEEGVMTDPYLQHRLVKLLGQGKYDTLVKVMYDCSPIGFNNELLYWVGYSQEKPASNGGAIIIDLNKDAIYVGLEINDQVQLFSEAGDLNNKPLKLDRWFKRRNKTTGKKTAPDSTAGKQ